MYFSSCEAYWHMFAFNIHGREPAVERLVVHLPRFFITSYLGTRKVALIFVEKTTKNNGYNYGENKLLWLNNLQPTEPCLSYYYLLSFSWYFLALSLQVLPTLMTHDADSHIAWSHLSFLGNSALRRKFVSFRETKVVYFDPNPIIKFDQFLYNLWNLHIFARINQLDWS